MSSQDLKTLQKVHKFMLYNKCLGQKNKKTAALLQRAGLQLPRGLFRNNGYIHSIRDNGSNVKPKFKNITESLQFKRWFGDWQKDPKHASRVVNAAESLSVTSSI